MPDAPTLRAVPDLPDYPEHGGRRVTWRPWQDLRVMCLPHRTCASCGSTEDAYYAAGLVDPAPGATFTVTQERPSARHPGRSWAATVQVPQWPVHSLAAFACRSCSHLEVYDTEADFRRVDTAAPTLF